MRLDRARYGRKSAIRRHETTWLALALSRSEYRDLVVRRSSDIVIDGYFRSANTFEDAVASELVRSPKKLADEAMKDWIFLYETARRVAGSFAIAPFDQVTSDFSQTIRTVNRMFDRDFALYLNSPAADAAAFDAVDNYFRAGRGQRFSAEKFGQVVGRPHAARSEELGAARRSVNRETASETLTHARELHAEFLELAEQQRAAV